MAHDLSRRGLIVAGGTLAIAAAAGAAPAGATTFWQSKLVSYDRRGRLAYAQDAEGNRIPDFSHAGYRNGERPIPHARVVKAIRPVEGDNTAHVQAALDEIAALPRRLRGALLLLPGLYPVAGTLYVRADGMVLRGSGDGADPAGNTIIKATGNNPKDRDVIVVGGAAAGGWKGEVPGTRTDITTDFVQVGARECPLGRERAMTGTDCDVSITYGKVSVIELASDNQAGREIASWIHRYDEAAGRAVTGRGDLPVGGSVKRQASCSTARAAYAAWAAA
ncbi:hypothetical protein [Nonomuraea guangzhouensis]|uniref:Uncharacterized protein n=1 Tax=Nonomuraea guangzhouensis TaxID=1291555 RepID=A0ABW4G005_9ACTN|nr:hypothetical protein [Nonomuraea guangzhouensis]